MRALRRVLITGGAGFLGSRLCVRLLFADPARFGPVGRRLPSGPAASPPDYLRLPIATLRAKTAALTCVPWNVRWLGSPTRCHPGLRAR
ncbi:hypothetical protein [Mycobacterium sp. P7213]|uniref:hypothetical protein n=1 Tax=Mycobacterium sp. P7213 TaxID=2478465 RepID=UPI000F6293F5|nr:hypothetical protein [Mycobacterium sp. P7213]